jgi:hypothetical protein
VSKQPEPVQKQFECSGCGLRANADTDFAINLDRRLTDAVLRKLCIRRMFMEVSPQADEVQGGAAGVVRAMAASYRCANNTANTGSREQTSSIDKWRFKGGSAPLAG